MSDDFWRVEVKPISTSAGWEVYPHASVRSREDGERVLANLANGQAFAARLVHYEPDVVASWIRADGKAEWSTPSVAENVMDEVVAHVSPSAQSAPSVSRAREARREQIASGRRARK